MQNYILQIHNLLIKHKKTISLAESCTGGLLSSYLTKFSGSSKYFLLGVIVYSNKSKNSILKISMPIIKENGAVSAIVAELMAKSIRKIAKSDFSIALTGIAGPTGGSIAKPVGTVFIAVSGKNQLLCRKFLFKGNRASIQRQAAKKSLELLKQIFKCGHL